MAYESATQERPYRLASEYGVFWLLPTSVEDLYTGYFNGDLSMSDDNALKMAMKSLRTVSKSIRGKEPTGKYKPEIMQWKRVTPWRPVMTAKAIKDRAWDGLYDLQGHRRTWYNSLLFMPGAPQLWNYTETELLPRIYKACKDREIQMF